MCAAAYVGIIMVQRISTVVVLSEPSDATEYMVSPTYLTVSILEDIAMIEKFC